MSLIAPHGGTLASLLQFPPIHGALEPRILALPCWDLSTRQICDLEMLLTGAFSPLRGFMVEADYLSCLSSMRLADGTVWPIPITLDVDESVATKACGVGELLLRDLEGVPLAVLRVASRYAPDLHAEALAVFGTTDASHPGVAYLLRQTRPIYLGGELLGISKPAHYDFPNLRLTPAELRARFVKAGLTRIVAFQTRNPLHRAHIELTRRAAESARAHLLLHPVVGLTKPGDVDHYTRVRTYQAVLPHYPDGSASLALLNLAMRMGGPREALWHALIRKNFGCSHFIVGRDHAGPGKDASGKDFYGAFDAQKLVAEFQGEIDIEMLPFEELIYVQERAGYYTTSEVLRGESVLSISGTELRNRLQLGLAIPDWFSYPEVIAELQKSYPARAEQGFTVLFTGLSGAGKSTIANALMAKLMEAGGRAITMLDGDIVRKHLSSELGFSRAHRDLNVQRIGYVASEITKNRGIAICAAIAPYANARLDARNLVQAFGAFLEIHVSTSLEDCEKRDRKGLYAAARSGKILGFTGISDPYEVPAKPELRIDTVGKSVAACVDEIYQLLLSEGLIVAPVQAIPSA